MFYFIRGLKYLFLFRFFVGFLILNCFVFLVRIFVFSVGILFVSWIVFFVESIVRLDWLRISVLGCKVFFLIVVKEINFDLMRFVLVFERLVLENCSKEILKIYSEIFYIIKKLI